MSYLMKESMEGRLVEVTVSVKLTNEAYQEFVRLVEAAISKYGRIRVLLITLGFQGWNAGSRWDDKRFDLNNLTQIERLAIVGESKWEKGMSVFCDPFKTAMIKYFELGDLDEARQWIHE